MRQILRPHGVAFQERPVFLKFFVERRTCPESKGEMNSASDDCDEQSETQVCSAERFVPTSGAMHDQMDTWWLLSKLYGSGVGRGGGGSSAPRDQNPTKLARVCAKFWGGGGEVGDLQTDPPPPLSPFEFSPQREGEIVAFWAILRPPPSPPPPFRAVSSEGRCFRHPCQ